MKMDKLRFFAKFLIFLVILYCVWLFVVEKYSYVVLYSAKVVLELMGYTIKAQFDASTFSATSVVSGIIPFIALVLATPKVELGNKAKAILAGSLILFAVDVVIMVSLTLSGRSEFMRFTFEFLEGIGAVALPFILWIFFMYRDLIPKTAGGGKKDFVNVMKEFYSAESGEGGGKKTKGSD